MFKLLNSNLTHHGFTYKEGLNVLTEPFNTEKECGAGGLYYCSSKDIISWINLTDEKGATYCRTCRNKNHNL